MIIPDFKGAIERFDKDVFWKVILKHLTPETQAFIRQDYKQELEKAFAKGYLKAKHEGYGLWKKDENKY